MNEGGDNSIDKIKLQDGGEHHEHFSRRWSGIYWLTCS
jgi:hypothetical protein